MRESSRAGGFCGPTGLRVGDDVIGYLLAHGRRDMRLCSMRLPRSTGIRSP
jgi:hypothetical protein